MLSPDWVVISPVHGPPYVVNKWCNFRGLIVARGPKGGLIEDFFVDIVIEMTLSDEPPQYLFWTDNSLPCCVQHRNGIHRNALSLFCVRSLERWWRLREKSLILNLVRILAHLCLEEYNPPIFCPHDLSARPFTVSQGLHFSRSLVFSLENSFGPPSHIFGRLSQIPLLWSTCQSTPTTQQEVGFPSQWSVLIWHFIDKNGENDVDWTVLGLNLGIVEPSQEVPKQLASCLFYTEKGGDALLVTLACEELLAKSWRN